MLDDLAAALAGKRVTIVPGNHDHRLVEPLLERLRVEGGEPGAGLVGGAARRRRWPPSWPGCCPTARCVLAYPGLWLRPDVYALHGHYLDLHMTVPRARVRCSGQALARRTLGAGPPTSARPTTTSTSSAPLYALSYNLAQGPGRGRAQQPRGSRNLSRTRLGRRPRTRNGAGRRVPGRPGGDPGRGARRSTRPASARSPADLSGEDLRRSGLEAMARGGGRASASRPTT